MEIKNKIKELKMLIEQELMCKYVGLKINEQRLKLRQDDLILFEEELKNRK
jgi:hypothetical protein